MHQPAVAVQQRDLIDEFVAGVAEFRRQRLGLALRGGPFERRERLEQLVRLHLLARLGGVEADRLCRGGVQLGFGGVARRARPPRRNQTAARLTKASAAMTTKPLLLKRRHHVRSPAECNVNNTPRSTRGSRPRAIEPARRFQRMHPPMRSAPRRLCFSSSSRFRRRAPLASRGAGRRGARPTLRRSGGDGADAPPGRGGILFGARPRPAHPADRRPLPAAGSRHGGRLSRRLGRAGHHSGGGGDRASAIPPGRDPGSGRVRSTSRWSGPRVPSTPVSSGRGFRPAKALRSATRSS